MYWICIRYRLADVSISDKSWCKGVGGGYCQAMGSIQQRKFSIIGHYLDLHVCLFNLISRAYYFVCCRRLSWSGL